MVVGKVFLFEIVIVEGQIDWVINWVCYVVCGIWGEL